MIRIIDVRMPQISKRRLHPDVEEKVRNLLVECTARCHDQRMAANFIDVLLTQTEKLMIAKRIAIALMLMKEYSANQIGEKLKVSQGTIYTVKAWLDAKGREYRQLLEEIALQDSAQETTHAQQQKEVTSSLPPPPGTNWKAFRTAQWKKVRESKVPF